MTTEEYASEILNACFRVHTALGPGLLESAYEGCLFHELRKKGVAVVQQMPMPIRYDGVLLDVGYRLDLLVGDCMIVEIKAVETVLPVHRAQVITYLKLSGKTLGLLLNFNVAHMKEGVSRIVLGHPSPSSNLRVPLRPLR